MLNDLKKTLKHTIIYGLGNVLSKLVGLILLPLYTEHLTTEEYGVLALLEVTSQLAIVFFTFKIPQAMLRWCSTEKDPDKEKSIIYTSLISVLLLGLLVFILGAPFSRDFSLFIFGTEKFTLYFTVVFLWATFGIIIEMPLSLMRLKEKSVFYGVINLSRFITVLGLNIYFIAYAKYGVLGIVLGNLIGNMVFAFASYPFVHKHINFKFHFPLFKELFNYGFPLSFSALSVYLLSFGDRYILQYFLPLSSVGIYSLGYKLASFINVFILQAFQLGYAPYAYKMLNTQSAGRYFSKVMTYFVFVLTFTVLGLSIFSEEIVKLLAKREEYYVAYTVVPIIAFAFLLRGINYIFALAFQFVKKTSLQATLITGGMILNILLNFVLIPYLDIYGAAISMALSLMTMNIVAYYFAQKSYKIPYELKKIFLLLIYGCLLYLSSLLITGLPAIAELFFKLLLLMIFPFGLLLFNFYEPIELTRIRQSWHKWKNPRRWKDNFKKISL